MSSTADSNSCVGSKAWSSGVPTSCFGQGIGESDAPEMVCGFAIAAAGGEATQTSDGVAHGQAGGEAVAGGQRGHVMFAQKPNRRR